MFDRNKLRAAWIAKGYTQNDVARYIGVSVVTFSRHFRHGDFKMPEILAMAELLDIESIENIFFAKEVT